MKKNFNKEFKNEFDQVFKPTLDKELLKEKLDIQPVDNANNIVFNKKLFYRLSFLCTLVLIILTAVITLGITKWVSYNEDTPVNEEETETDVIKMFQDMYKDCSVSLITECFIQENSNISIIKIKSNNNPNNKLIVYFNDILESRTKYTTYELFINNINYQGTFLKKDQYIEYEIQCDSDLDIKMVIYYCNVKIFEFCTFVE